MNPYPEAIVDECSGQVFPNPEYVAYQKGVKDERERILSILEKEYPAITTWKCWKELKGEQ